MAQLKRDQTPLTVAQLDALTKSARYYSCTSCSHSKRFWRKEFNCPVWKCRFGRQNCPRVGNRCPDFDKKTNTFELEA